MKRRRIRWGRIAGLTFWLVLTGVVLTGYFVTRRWIREFIRIQVSDSLRNRMNQEVHIGQAGIDFTGPLVWMEDVRWVTRGPRGSTMFANIRRIEIRLWLRPIVKRRIWIRSIELFEPRIQVNYDVRGRANWPDIRTPRGGPGWFQVKLEEIRVRNLTFFLKHDGIPLMLGLMKVDARFRPQAGTHHMVGMLRIGQGLLQVHDYNPWRFKGGIQSRLSLKGPEFDAAHLYGNGFHLWGTGRVVGYGSPYIDLTLVASVDNRVIQQVHSISFRVQGQGNGIVHYDGDFSIFRMLGWVKSQPYRMGRLVFDQVAGPIHMTQHRLILDGLHGVLNKGEVQGDFLIDPLFGISRFNLTVAGKQIDGNEFGRMWGLKKIHHITSFDGMTAITWRENRFDHLLGWTVVRANAPPGVLNQGDNEWPPSYRVERAYPVDLDFRGELDGFRYRYALASGRIGNLEGRVEGRIDFDGGLDVKVEGRTTRIGEVDTYYHQWLWNLEPEMRSHMEMWEFEGEGAFKGRASHRVQDIALDGQFQGRHMKYLDVFWGDITTNVRYWHNIFQFAHASITDGDYRIDTEQTYIYLGQVGYKIDGDTYSELKFLGYPVERVLAPTPLGFLPLRGVMRGLLTVRGNYQQVDLLGDLNLLSGTIFNIPLDYGMLRFSYVNFLFQAELGKAAFKGGLLQFMGRWNRMDGRFDDFRVDVDDFPLDSIGLLQDNGFKGELTLNAVLNGSYVSPQGYLHGHITDVSWKDYELGDFVLRNLDDRFGIGLWLFQDKGLVAKASLDVDLGRKQTRGEWIADRLTIKPWSDIMFTGNGVMTGMVNTEGRPIISVTMNQGQLSLQGSTLVLARATTWNWNENELEITPTEWRFGERTLHLSGRVAYQERVWKPEIKVQGDFDLSVLTPFMGGISLDGLLHLDTFLTLDEHIPRLEGSFTVTRGRLDRKGWPFSLRDLKVQSLVQGDIWEFSQLSARIGGGIVNGSGRMVWPAKRARPEFFQFNFSGENIQYPFANKGFLRADGRGTLSGVGERLMLTANLDVDEGELHWIWRGWQGLNLSQAPPSSRYPLGGKGNPLPLENLELNVATRVSTPLPLSFTFGSMGLKTRVTWNIRTTGAAKSPGFIGVINFHGGTLNFLNRIFNLTQGQVQFVNPLEIRPVLRFQAETQIQNYIIQLTISGSLPQPMVQLTSDPALPPSTILNLLGGQVYEPGQQREEATGFYTSFGSHFLLTFLTSPLASPAQKVLGIERLSLDFWQLGPEAQPVPRLTLGKSVSDRLNMTYSIGLAAIQNQIWLIEYSLNEALRLLVTRDEEGFWGLDVFWRK